MRPKRLLRRCLEPVAACVVVLGIAGCVVDPGEEKAMQNLKAMSRADARQMTDDYAGRTVAMIGGGVDLVEPETGTVPCEDPGGKTSETVYFAAGHYQIAPIPGDQQLSTLRRLRAHWQQQGYTIKKDRVFSEGRRGELVVENPSDEFEIRLVTTEPPTAFALSISSPCYHSDEPWPAPVSDSPTDGG